MQACYKLISLILLLFILGCGPKIDEQIKLEYPNSVMLTVKNETDLVRVDEAVVFDPELIKARSADFNPNAFVVFCEATELASQANDLNGDGEVDEIVVLTNFNPNEQKKLNFLYASEGSKSREYLKRTQAEISIKVGGQFVDRKYEGGTFQNIQFLRVPPEHTDHSNFIRYEGPGWESDIVGYRFYLDWRNAIDIFGKKTPEMVLQNVGQDNFDSYHEMAAWGMDILKVAESLGIGTIGMWFDSTANRVAQTDSVTFQIVLNKPVESMIRTNYYGWKVGSGIYHLTSELSICAGSRMTRHALQIDGNAENLCTGLIKLPDTELIQSAEKDGWMYLATYGKQSLANDLLGMAILFHQKDLIELTEDQLNHVVVLKPENGNLTYHFLAAWEQEPNGIRTKDEFVRYLNEVVKKLNQPIIIE